jgi:hypothetical protein
MHVHFVLKVGLCFSLLFSVYNKVIYAISNKLMMLFYHIKRPIKSPHSCTFYKLVNVVQNVLFPHL